MRSFAAFFAGLALVTGASLLACSSSSSSTDGADAGIGDAGAGDADAAPRGPACAGDCSTLTASALFTGNTMPFDHAQFGTETVDGGQGYHVEVHAGGTLDCPTQTSPTPDRSFVLSNVPHLAAGATATEKDGVRAAYLDFVGDSGAPLVRSTAVSVTMTVADTATKPAWIAFDVDAKFPTGSVSGHVYATYCDSLSLP